MNPLLAAIGLPYVPDWGQLRAFAPELWLIAAIVAVLLTPFFVKKANAACGLVALAGLLAALVSLFVVWDGRSGEHFRGLLVIDSVAVFWKGLLLLFVIGIVLMWFGTTAVRMHEGDGPEFFTLLLGATLGMSLMASTSNVLMLIIAVEMASLPSYVLAGFRKTHRVGAEASLKYVLFGAATSSIMAYGLSMLYGLYGTLQIDGTGGLAQQIAAGGGSALLWVAMLALIVGLGFKISAVPFHFWCPDVFEGASMEVSAFLSVASNGAGLVLLMRVMLSIASAQAFDSSTLLTGLAVVIGVIGAITATVGTTAAFVQHNIKRLLAWSSIAHAGYMLCIVSLLVRGPATAAGFDPASTAVQVVLFYLAAYLFMNLGAFTVAGLIERETGSEQIADYAGMGRRSPLIAFCMTACLLSLVGLPPFAGFVAKVNLFWALMQNGTWWWWLVGVIGVNTVLSLYYYVRVIKVMYLKDSPAPPLWPHPLGAGVAVVCAVILIVMLIAFGPINRLAQNHSHFNGVQIQSTAESIAGEIARR
ncbi:MAG: NADH-quinone oxidoreductase subunit N [Phycisphaerales bacterium]|nr:NADH-quinone oxidoreductase subunit N [Phycisphaerales bacterium]